MHIFLKIVKIQCFECKFKWNFLIGQIGCFQKIKNEERKLTIEQLIDVKKLRIYWKLSTL